MTTKLFTNLTLPSQLSSLPNVYHQQAEVLDLTQDSMIALFDAILVNHANGPGWTKPFSGTNKAVYRAAGGGQRYLRLWDNPGDEAMRVDVRAYESMSDVDTGVNETPGSTNISDWLKAGRTGPEASNWAILCDEAAVYFFMNPQNDNSQYKTAFLIWGFGDLNSFVSSASYFCFLASSSASQNHLYATGASPLGRTSKYKSADGNLVVLRGPYNLGTHRSFSLAGDNQSSNSYIQGSEGSYAPPTPNPVTGKIDIEDALVWCDGDSHAGAVAGKLPGLFSPRHKHNDDFLCPNPINYLEGTGDFAGEKFVVFRHLIYANNYGPFIFSLGGWR